MERLRGPIRQGVDFHLHTIHSRADSSLTPRDLVKRAKARQIFQAAVTNHNTVEGADEVLEIAHEMGVDLAVIKGEEIKTSDNIELLAYFIKETIPARLSIEQTLRDTYKQGGLIGIPHPFEDRRWGVGERAIEVLRMAREIGFEVILWEVFNARSSPANNGRALSFFHLNQNKYNLLPIVGSDAHSKWEVGNARWLWVPKSETKEELIANLEKSVHNGTWFQGEDNIWKSRGNRSRNQVLVALYKLLKI